MLVTIVSGTNRPNNLSIKVAKRCQDFLEGQGIATELLDLADLPREIAFDYLEENARTGFLPYQQLVDSTTHFVFVAPEYNGSIPGILKLFIDACDYPGSFRGKSAALVGIAAGKAGNERGLNHLRDILTYFGMDVFTQHVTVGKIREKLAADGAFRDEIADQILRSMLLDYATTVIAR
jgi:chromate reductase